MGTEVTADNAQALWLDLFVMKRTSQNKAKQCRFQIKCILQHIHTSSNPSSSWSYAQHNNLELVFPSYETSYHIITCRSTLSHSIFWSCCHMGQTAPTSSKSTAGESHKLPTGTSTEHLIAINFTAMPSDVICSKHCCAQLMLLAVSLDDNILQCLAKVFTRFIIFHVLLPHNLQLKWIVWKFAPFHLQNMPTTLKMCFFLIFVKQTINRTK